MSNHPSPSPKDSPSKYRSVIEGMELANQFASSGQRLSEFARQRGVSPRMVVYWSTRARQLAAATTTPALVPVAELGADGVLEAVRASSCEGNAEVASSVSPAPAATTSLTVPRSPSAAPVIMVHLANGARIAVGPGFSPELLKQVITCLGGR